MNCSNFGDIANGTNAGIVGKGVNGTGSGFVFENCENYGNVKNAGICAERSNICRTFTNCNNYGRVTSGPGIAVAVTEKGCMKNCKNFGEVSGAGLVSDLNSNAILIECENHSSKKCYAGFVEQCRGRIYKCRNYADATYGFVYRIHNNSIVEQCETDGAFDYYLGYLFDGGGKIYNCIIRGSTSKNKTTQSNNNAKIESVLFIGTIIGTKRNQYYGSDFSAFYINRKKGYIGLKSLDDAGVFGLCGITTDYLNNNGFVQIV